VALIWPLVQRQGPVVLSGELNSHHKYALFLTNWYPLSSTTPLKQSQFLHHIPYGLLHHLASSASFQVPTSLQLSVVFHLTTVATSALFHAPTSSIPTYSGTSHDLLPWEIWLKSKIKAKHFLWIKIVFYNVCKCGRVDFTGN